MLTREMTITHPLAKERVSEPLIACIDNCFACAQSCTACADACLAESDLDALKQCIRLNLDCADICVATGTIASRQTGSNGPVVRQMLEICAEICWLCGEECRIHAGAHDHCGICADECRSCEEACRNAMIEIG